jgi:hypothetical protein
MFSTTDACRKHKLQREVSFCEDEVLGKTSSSSPKNFSRKFVLAQNFNFATHEHTKRKVFVWEGGAPPKKLQLQTSPPMTFGLSMSHLLTMSQAPCVECKSSFVKCELETIKLRQNHNDGTRWECETPVFNGEGTVECFFYVEESFCHHAAKMEWTAGPEMFDNFEEILQDTALEKWETRTQNIAPADQTMGHFTQAVDECLLECVDPLAKDHHMIKHLKDFRHPMHVKPWDHATQIETLICCTNCLPGAEDDVTTQQTKNVIFESFPVAWRQSWIRAGKSLVTNALAELVQFMANKQSFAHNKDKIKKKDGSGNKTKESHRGDRDRSHQWGRGRDGSKRQDRESGRGGRGSDNRDNKHSKMDQVQTMIVLSMVNISGASVTRILKETIAILQEEVERWTRTWWS